MKHQFCIWVPGWGSSCSYPHVTSWHWLCISNTVKFCLASTSKTHLGNTTKNAENPTTWAKKGKIFVNRNLFKNIYLGEGECRLANFIFSAWINEQWLDQLRFYRKYGHFFAVYSSIFVYIALNYLVFTFKFLCQVWHRNDVLSMDGVWKAGSSVNCVFSHLVRMNVILKYCKKGFPVYSSAAFEGPASGVYSDHAESILSLLMMRQHINLGICLSLEVA